MNNNEMLLELLDCNDLSKWEYDFINDMCDLENFTEKQQDKIKEIYINHMDD